MHMCGELDSAEVERCVSAKVLAGTLGCEGHSPVTMLEPRGIAVDAQRGAVYIAELYCVRRLDLNTGVLSTLVGQPNADGFVDGSVAQARFNNLRGIALSPDGSELVVCDFWNHHIRSIVLGVDGRACAVRSVAGSTVPRAQALCTPNDVAFDSSCRLFVACGSGFDDDSVRSLAPRPHDEEEDGDATASKKLLDTVAGQPGTAGAADGECLSSTFDSPQGIAVEPDRPIVCASICSISNLFPCPLCVQT